MKTVKIPAKVSVPVPNTADEWELYGSMKCGPASRALTAALKKSLQAFAKDPSIGQYAALGPWYDAANKYADFGAGDSEPVYHAQKAMQRLAEKLGVTK